MVYCAYDVKFRWGARGGALQSLYFSSNHRDTTNTQDPYSILSFHNMNYLQTLV